MKKILFPIRALHHRLGTRPALERLTARRTFSPKVVVSTSLAFLVRPVSCSCRILPSPLPNRYPRPRGGLPSPPPVSRDLDGDGGGLLRAHTCRPAFVLFLAAVAYSDPIRPPFRGQTRHCSDVNPAPLPTGLRPAFRADSGPFSWMGRNVSGLS